LKTVNDEIYSALEYQYRLGLESLNENLPEISADLILRRDGSIEFSPPFDDLKQKYFLEIRNFIDYPKKARVMGSGGQSL
jgi:dynein heavy chain 2